MSIGKRIIEGARSGLNSLLDRVAADDTPLSGIEREALDAELALRVEARKAAAGGGATPARARPEDNPRARWAGAGDEAARKRREAADAREQKVRSVRAEKKRAREAERAAQAAAQEEAWRKIREEARRAGAGGTGAGTGTGTGRAGTGTGRGARAGAGTGTGARAGAGRIFGRDDKIAKYYHVLDLPYGADFEQVKAAYRKLMRRYHPDLHGQSPQKQKAATELTMQVTQAYNELEIHLARK